MQQIFDLRRLLGGSGPLAHSLPSLSDSYSPCLIFLP